jgi:hypothetical protein
VVRIKKARSAAISNARQLALLELVLKIIGAYTSIRPPLLHPTLIFTTQIRLLYRIWQNKPYFDFTRFSIDPKPWRTRVVRVYGLHLSIWRNEDQAHQDWSELIECGWTILHQDEQGFEYYVKCLPSKRALRNKGWPEVRLHSKLTQSSLHAEPPAYHLWIDHCACDRRPASEAGRDQARDTAVLCISFRRPCRDGIDLACVQ